MINKFNKMCSLQWFGSVLWIYLQVSFGNASFLYAELKILHLPNQQEKTILLELFMLLLFKHNWGINDL